MKYTYSLRPYIVPTSVLTLGCPDQGFNCTVHSTPHIIVKLKVICDMSSELALSAMATRLGSGSGPYEDTRTHCCMLSSTRR